MMWGAVELIHFSGCIVCVYIYVMYYITDLTFLSIQASPEKPNQQDMCIYKESFISRNWVVRLWRLGKSKIK